VDIRRVLIPRFLVFILASSLTLAAPQNCLAALPQEVPARPTSYSLSSELLKRIFTLIEENGREHLLEAPISNPLDLSNPGEGWPIRDIAARDNEADSSSPLHNIAISTGDQDDILLYHWVGPASLYIRIRRTGEIVKAISYDPSVGNRVIPPATAEREAKNEIEFWNKHAEKTGFWRTCMADLKGERSKDSDKKLAACTWLIQSGDALPGEVATAYVHRAWAHGREHAEMTQDDLSQAVRLNPADSFAWAQLCSIQGTIGKDTREAIQSCSKSLQLNPHSPEAWTFRGDIHLRNREYDDAIADYNHAIKLAPRWMWPLDNRGEAYLRSNQIERAITDFKLVIEVSPDYAIGYLSRGIAEMKKNNRDLAITFFEHGIKVDPNCAACFFGRGIVKRRNGDEAGADADVTKARALDSKVDGDFADEGITLN
jgi:tetratricopeptide (TPR) repeat protein